MRRLIMFVTVAARRLALDGVAFIGSRYARRVLVLCATLTAAMLVGLLGYATSARADVACVDRGSPFCVEKTATPDPVTAGEPLTFTVRAYCIPTNVVCGAIDSSGMTDTLPKGLEFVSASATGTTAFGDPPPTCSESAGTVKCAPAVYFADSRGDPRTVPFVATIKVIPRQCGTFTNTASLGLGSVSETFTVEDCDTTPPTLTVTHTGANANGWNNTSPVTLNISASDTESGLAADPTCKDGTTDLPLAAGSTAGTWTTSVSGEDTHTINCSITDNAGNSTSASDTVNIDTTPPTLTVTHTADGSGGWNNTSPVTVNVSASDSGSGLTGAPTCKDGTTDLSLAAGSTAGNWTASVSGEGTHIVECTVSDQGGNQSTASDTVKIGTQAPMVISAFPRNGGEVGPAANIRATFSEDMQEASVVNAFKLFKKGSTTQIAALVSYDAATDTATLDPTNNLKKGATYKAVVSTQAKDEAGNRLDQDGSRGGLQQKVWFFEIDN